MISSKKVFIIMYKNLDINEKINFKKDFELLGFKFFFHTELLCKIIDYCIKKETTFQTNNYGKNIFGIKVKSKTK